MLKIHKIIFLFVVIFGLFLSIDSYADESALITSSVNPDALIVLDLSYSMVWNPTDDVNKATHIWGNSSCSGTFYDSSGTGHTYNCSRIAIAKRAICQILDDTGNGCLDSNNDGTIDTHNITTADESSLKIRIGYMRFYACNKDSSAEKGASPTYDYSSGCNTIIRALNTTNKEIGEGGYGPNYSDIWSSVSGENITVVGYTPDAAALYEAKLYLDAHKNGDNSSSCRKKFVILITDGEDTMACDNDGGSDHKNRKSVVARAKALADAGYKVFVIGFGSAMGATLERTLNWAAYYGGTDNPNVANSGSTSAVSVAADPCESSASNDPEDFALSGYAFLAADADELKDALRQAMNIIKEANYSFSTSSVSSTRISTENYLYEASFKPVNNDPFWEGHLKKYPINSDGSLGSAVRDAGTVLSTTAASSRNILTYTSGGFTRFSTSTFSAPTCSACLTQSVTASNLAVTTDTERDNVVGYIRGESAKNPDDWKLGDIFHSNAITMGSPSSFFNDTLDSNNAFSTFRSDHPRTSSNGLRRLVVGANDGQLHAFRISDTPALDLSEMWSFIPPNLLSKLKNIAHSSHPTSLSHQYMVDGPVTVADVWLGTGSGSTKSASDWKTIMVFGEGKGGSSTLWSSSSSCDSGFSSTYDSSTYSYYCGYYAFDFTTTSSPTYKWRINPTSSNAAYLGEPWSKMGVGRVKISGNEKWVGFIGGGYNDSNCSGGGSCDTRGKGFYAIDLNNGDVLWSYTRANTTTMTYSIPATPGIVDTDNDGFIDTAYVGDLEGNIWRFKFCTKSAITDGTCTGTAHWSGGKLYNASGGGEGLRPVYSSATVTKDASGNLWIYWASGNKSEPTATSTNEKVFGIKDNDRTTTYTLSNLENVTSVSSQCNNDDLTKVGWYINFTGNEKALSDITVFGGVVYFTTYTSDTTNSNLCARSGTSRLYAVSYQNCAGMFSEGARSVSLGSGIASAPFISLKPGTAVPADLYVTTSGGSGTDAVTTRIDFNPPFLSNRTNMLFWKDKRVQ
ncbi:MAG: hypothetical protein A2077_01325 [Nitrospirae bacterium GWC2_46_6]|nr:MAG: hypothetical protein A2077_01325 [Nitrospirae bacterium GWC2_46_6]